MLAVITKILPTKQSRNGNIYQRIEFKLRNGQWVKTDLCQDYHNWKYWKDILQIGNILGQLELKDNQTIDADSHCVLMERPKQQTNLKLWT